MANRAQYKRKWVAAVRALRNTNNDELSDSSSTELSHPDQQLPNVQISNNDSAQSQSETVDPIAHEGFNDEHHDKRVCSNNASSDQEMGCIGLNLGGPSTSEVDTGDEGDALGDHLSKWVNDFQVKQNAVDSLLKILKQFGHPNLPSSARTLLNTTRTIPVQNKSGMQYIYFPLAIELLKNLGRYPSVITDAIETLELSFNIDGLPLFKSSQNSLWPVLCALVNVKPVTVFPVVLTYGKSKPDDLSFLEDIIRDLEYVLQNGIRFGNRTLSVVLRCIVCDAPARAFVRGTKLYSGYFGCDKCCQEGKWIGRLTYPDVVGVVLRTDLSFRDQSNKEHHKYRSPFCDLGIDMVKKFPIDYMHQVCLGVMKKMLLLWIRGKREVRISARQVMEISNNLVCLKEFIPSCFARKPRGLDEIDRWKATEFRQFLLYTGAIALSGVLRDDLYHHFLCLSVAISILVCPTLAQLHRCYAHELLSYFVQQGSVLYGEEFLVYNVHSLIHLAERNKENMVSVKKPNNAYILNDHSCCEVIDTINQQSEDGNQLFISEPNKENMVSVKKPNNAYILNDHSCCEVIDTINQQSEDGNQLFTCRIYESTIGLFNSPCDSQLIGIHRASS